jgi:4-hydroxybenzoate polyprenyltransferase/phosphoserine phosphatase
MNPMRGEASSQPTQDGAGVSAAGPDAATLFVDLDGTLVKTDLLIEELLDGLKKNPWYCFGFLRSLLKGRQCLKEHVGRLATIDVTSLPYHSQFVEFLAEERTKGRKLVLLTAANERIANQIAAHLGLFSGVLTSDDHLNLKGRNKLERIKQFQGEKPFDYAGNASADLEIWKCARNAIVVNAAPSVLNRARKLAKVLHVFARDTTPFKTLLKALRPHQWVKNLLLFVPLIAAHHLNDLSRLLTTCVGFVIFSLCASSAYLLNDLLDLRADRLNPTKCRRPFASGDLDPRFGLGVIPLLLFGSFAPSLFLPPAFTATLLVYYILTLGYSFYAKAIVMLDVVVLASLYTIRVFAGSVVANAVISQWLLAFAMFAFFSLAMIKRVSELRNLGKTANAKTEGRGYLVADCEQLAALGAASGCCSVLVLALYISSDAVAKLYSHPERLWLICPIVFYWMSRMWLLAHRGIVQEDPIVFALGDKTSYVVAALTAVTLFLSL